MDDGTYEIREQEHLAVLASRGRLRHFVPFTGTRVVVLEGDGTNPKIYREVTYWYDEKGELILRSDPCPESPT